MRTINRQYVNYQQNFRLNQYLGTYRAAFLIGEAVTKCEAPPIDDTKKGRNTQMRSPDTAARTLVNPQEDVSMAGLRRVVQPLMVNGKTLDQVFLGAELLLLERGELGAMKLAQQLRDQHETVEYRALLRLRQQGRGEKDGK